MEADNDFFEQLRKQSEQLAELPQPQTWERLESRLKKSSKPDKKANFLSWSFLKISILAAIVLITVAILAFLQYHNIVRKEKSLNFFSNLQHSQGVWTTKSDAKFLKDEIQIVNKEGDNIRFSKLIFFKNNLVNESYFTIFRKGNRNYLQQGHKVFSETRVEGNKIFFKSGEEKIEIVNDPKNNQIVFIYPERNTIVYGKNAN